MSDQLTIEVRTLCLRLFDGSLTETEGRRLNELLEDPHAQDIYFGLLKVNLTLRQAGESIAQLTAQPEQNFNLKTWQELAEFEKSAEPVTIEENTPQPLVTSVARIPCEKNKVNAWYLASLLNAAAALIFMICYAHFAPKKDYSGIEVATLVDQVNVQWVYPDVTLDNNSRLWTNNGPLELKKGIVKIRYDSGVDVLIEGPASFEIERSQVFLEYGRLFAQVSDSGLGFTVQTPTSRFVDMGTEFGALAEINGSSELHVIKGKVQLFTDAAGSSRTGQLITENTAMRYDANNDTTKQIVIQKNTFTRQINSETGSVWRGQKQLNLAEIVGGGNGWTGISKNLEIAPNGSRSAWLNYREGDGLYYPNPSPYIDGVFVPDSQQGCRTVSTLGHEFIDCPATSNLYHDNITNFLADTIKTGLVKTLESIDNSQTQKIQEQPLLFFHSNIGITFDLKAIRHNITKTVPVRFTAKGLILNSLDNRVSPNLDVWVLVNGQTRFSSAVDAGSGLLDISVDLSENDRFLSLVVTDGGLISDPEWPANHLDMFMFINPVVEME